MTNDKNLSGHTNPTFLEDDGRSQKLPPLPVSPEKNQHFEMSLQNKLPMDTYDPYKERIVSRPTTNTDTFIHLMKGSVGTGILAMPNAFRISGYLIGIIATIIIGAFCTYCVHILIRVEYELCKRLRVPVLNYPAVAKAAVAEGPNWIRPISNVAGHVVNTFLLLFQLGICSVYVVFVAFNVKAITDHYTTNETDIRLVMLAFFIPLVLLSWVKDLKYLVPFSSIGNFVTIISFAIICYYLFRNPITIEGKEAIGDPAQFPLFFGTVMFALEAIGVIFPLENEMKTPKSFSKPFGVLNNSMAVILFLYVGMGVFGYLNYGNEVAGSVTLNLPAEDILAQCAKAMLAFSFILSHGLACFVAIDIMWSDYFVKYYPVASKKVFWDYTIRTMAVIIPFLFAVAIPNIPLFISLIGAFCLSFLGLAFPAVIQTCAYWHYVRGYAKVWMLIKNVFIVLIGVAGLVIGTYMSIAEIIETFF